MLDKRLFAEVQNARLAFAVTIGASAIAGLLIVGQAWLFSRVIDRVFMGGATLTDVRLTLVGLAGIIVGRAILHIVTHVAAAEVAIRVRADLRQRLLRRLFQLGPAFTEQERTGELVATATEGIESLEAYFREYLPGLFTAVLIPLTILLFVFPIDLLTFIVLLITAPLIPVFMVLIGKAAGILAQRQYAALSQMSAHFLDVMQGLTTLKLFNRSRAQITTIAHVTGQFRQATLSVLRVAFLSALVLELLSTISIALVAVEIGLRLLSGHIDFQSAFFLFMIAPEFYVPLRTLGAKFHTGNDGLAAAQRIFAILGTPVSLRTAISTNIPRQLDIQFTDVSFAYDDGARSALNGVSFRLKQGQCVALVGESGSGKSTIARLLLRFIEPVTGQITVDDVGLSSLAPEAWREKIAWVPQSPYLFNTDIAENIRLGQPGASMEAVVEAAQLAGADEYIRRFPGGYETLCGERGFRLSGGQVQRVALARAFLRDAPILILDEATAYLDADTEALIATALRRLMQGRTTLVIAHRLHTITQADQILVLSQGEIVESGTHAQLLEQGGAYGNLLAAFRAGRGLSS